MNPYLIEPYNAYQKPEKKKHWMELAEEEALYHRMAQEALIREALTAQMTQMDSVQDGHSSCATITSPAAGAGAGGIPTWEWFQSNVELAGFTFSPASGGGPLSVSFSNTTRTPLDDTFYWTFGDGDTSTAVNPVHVFATGSWDIYMESTSSTGFTSFATSNITISVPVITAAFTRAPTTGSAPFTESFTNATTQTGDGALTYKWIFGDGGTTSALPNPIRIYDTGSFTITLSVTSSVYPSVTASNTATANITGTIPIVTAAGSVNGAATGTAPFTASFFNTSAQTNGVAIATYKWTFTSGSSPAKTSALATPSIGFETGSWTGSLEATGSYGTATRITYNNMIIATAPTLTSNFTVNSASGAAPLNVTFSSAITWVSSSTNPGTLTYNWNMGGSSSSAAANPTMSYSSSIYSVTLSVTESVYKITATKTSASFISASVT